MGWSDVDRACTEVPAPARGCVYGLRFALPLDCALVALGYAALRLVAALWGPR